MKLPAKLRRPDWLDELHGLLLVALGLTAAGTVAGLVATLTGHFVEAQIPADRSAVPGAVGTPLALTVEIPHPSAAQKGWAIAGELPRQLLILAVLALLWRAVGRARRTDPFGPGLARSFHRLGLLLVLGGPVVWILDFVSRTWLSNSVSTGGTSATLGFLPPLAWAFAGFGAFAIGEILRRGRALRVELDGVV